MILGSGATAHTLIDAIGVARDPARCASIVPIGPTTAAALAERGIIAEPPAQATFPAVIARISVDGVHAKPADDRMTLDRLFVECSALGFQSVVTTHRSRIACYVLWRRQRGPHFLTWSMAWAVYVVRLACMSAFLVRRDLIWLFLHQAATGISALLLLAAALQMSRGFVLRPSTRWRFRSSSPGRGSPIYGMGSMVVAGVIVGGAARVGHDLDRRRASGATASACPSGAAPVLAWRVHPVGAASPGLPAAARLRRGGALRRVRRRAVPVRDRPGHCCSWCSATSASGWRRGPPSSSS